MTTPIAPGPIIHELWKLYAGDTWQFQFSCQNTDGTYMDLTEALIEWKLDDREMTANKVTASRNNGITIIGPETYGQCLVKIESDVTATVAPGNYRDQLIVTKNAGGVMTLSVGPIAVFAGLK